MGQSFLPTLPRLGLSNNWFVNDFYWSHSDSFFQEHLLSKYLNFIILVGFKIEAWLLSLNLFFFIHADYINIFIKNIEINYKVLCCISSSSFFEKDRIHQKFIKFDDFYLYGRCLLKINNVLVYTCNILKKNIGYVDYFNKFESNFLNILSTWCTSGKSPIYNNTVLDLLGIL